MIFQKRDDGFDIKNDYQEQKQNECQQHQNNGNDAEIVGAGKIAAENPGHDVQIAGHRAKKISCGENSYYLIRHNFKATIYKLSISV